MHQGRGRRKEQGWCEELERLGELVQGGSVLNVHSCPSPKAQLQAHPLCEAFPITLNESSQLLCPCVWAAGFSKGTLDQESGYLGPTLSSNMLCEHEYGFTSSGNQVFLPFK